VIYVELPLSRSCFRRARGITYWRIGVSTTATFIHQTKPILNICTFAQSQSVLIYEDAWTEDLFNHAMMYVERNLQNLGFEIGAIHRLDYKIIPSLGISQNCKIIELYVAVQLPRQLF
jgi:hypothetical protein